MNVMREIERMNARELELGIAESASWHADYSHSAYVFIGGLDYELTEGDIICFASQYGEVVDCNLVRDKTTGRSRGFCFVAYEDQRSAVLVIDNLNGFRLLSRSLRVDHADRYRRPKTDAAASADSELLMFEGEEEAGYDQRRKRIWDYTLYPPLPVPAATAAGAAAGSGARAGGGGERAAGAGSAPTSYTVDLTRVGAQELGEDSSAGRILRLWEEKKRKRQEREAEERRKEREEKDKREGRAVSFGDQLLPAARPQPVSAKSEQEPERRERSVEKGANRDSSRERHRQEHRRRERHSDDNDHWHRRRRHRSRSRSRSADRSRRDCGRR